MKNLMKLIPVLCLLIFGSCKKDDAQYPANPYNYIGEEHNTLLTVFYDTYGAELEVITDEREREGFIFHQMAELQNEEIDLLKSAKDWLGLDETQLIADYDFTRPDAIFQKTGIISEVRLQLNKTVNEIKDLDPDDEKLIEKTDELIQELEEELFRDYQFTDDFTPAMKYLATLKYSNKFWKNLPTQQKPSKAKWWQKVLADTAGALVGVGVTYITAGAGVGTTVAMAGAFSAAV